MEDLYLIHQQLKARDYLNGSISFEQDNNNKDYYVINKQKKLFMIQLKRM